MNQICLIEKLITLIQLQAEIILEQSNLIEQLDGIAAEDKITAAAKERESLGIAQEVAV